MHFMYNWVDNSINQVGTFGKQNYVCLQDSDRARKYTRGALLCIYKPVTFLYKADKDV